MNRSDFRHMNQGRHIREPSLAEMALLKPVTYTTGQNKRALLVLHGFASSPACYRLVLPQIQHYDAVVCPVLPGHGESLEAFNQSRGEDWYETAKKHCALLMEDYQQVDILGLSLGGLLACRLSKEFALNHLYLLAPALKLHMNITFMLALAQFFKILGFQHLRNASGNVKHPWHTELSYSKLPLTTICEVLTLIQTFSWEAPACPIDVFLGRHDVIVDSLFVEQLFLPLPNARIHWLEQSAHVLTLDNDLEQISQCLNQAHSKKTFNSVRKHNIKLGQ